MAGMSGGSMLRTRRKDVNVKPNRRLDRKSSRGMLYENEELRLRTININAEVERGQSDIKKLKRENEQLRREVGALRGEYDRLERLLQQRQHQESPEPENQEEDKVSIISCCSDCSIDCCNNRSSDMTCCDSTDVIKCSKYPACHSLEMVENHALNVAWKHDVTCQSDAEIEKNDCEECQKEKSRLEDECQNCITCQKINENRNKRNTDGEIGGRQKKNRFNFDLKTEQHKEHTTTANDDGKINKRKANVRGAPGVVDCQNETNENDVNVASDCGRFFSCQMPGDSGEDSVDEGHPTYLGCRRLDLDIARCCGTLLSPVPEETSNPRTPSWIPEASQNMCSCQSNNNNNNQEQNNMEKTRETDSTENSQDYFKAMVTVPLTSHIPGDNNNTTAEDGKDTNLDTILSDPISVFPKTGLDILMNNNCYEKFEGFTATHPLGFVLPAPIVNPDMAIAQDPFQRIGQINAQNFSTNNNFESANSVLTEPNVSNVNNPQCSNINRIFPPNISNIVNTVPSAFQNVPFSSNNELAMPVLNDPRNIEDSHSDPFIFTERGNITPGSRNFCPGDLNHGSNSMINPLINTTVVGSNLTTNGQQQFVATSSRNIMSANDNYQTNTVMTTNGLIFTSNCPIMSSNASTNIPAMMNTSISPTNSLNTNNTSWSISPSSLTTIVPFLREHSGFKNDAINDSISDMDSTITESGVYKDSFFVCKTRKVIQHLTTVHNSNFNSVTSPCGCTCRCNQQINEPSQEVTSETVSSVSDRNSRNTRFRTEKSIELNYDYPKSFEQQANEETTNEATAINNEETKKSNESVNKINSDNNTQTIQTTTEVNSTLFMFERKKVPLKSKTRHNMSYERSNSAPVEIPSDEPIYATVNKLPKKLKRLNIRKLENEIKYVPPETVKKKDEEIKDNGEDIIKNINNLIGDSSEETKDNETKDKIEVKSNGVATNNVVTKSDSFSESSDKNNSVQKTPTMVRKKKKFSIRFKRKCSKASKTSVERKMVDDDCNKYNSKHEETDDASRVSSEKQLVIGSTNSKNINRNNNNANNSDSDNKLIHLDATSSSPDSPDVNQSRDSHFCKKHGKLKHNHHHHHHYKSGGCESSRCCNREEYPHHRCTTVHNKHNAIAGQGEFGSKKHLHPSRNYFKQDSYQEMTTSHSERERTNSLSSSGHSGFSLGSKARSGSHSRREGSIPWCGCWGNSCL